jgi:hypothetical protein
VITVVSGAPCSGKSTYIREHAKPGDIVIDLDPLCRALTVGYEDGHMVPEYVAHIALGARNGALKRALRLRERRNGVRVFVIHTAPKPQDLSAYRVHRAEIVVMDPGKEVCLERASRLRPHVTQVIEDWYSGKLHRARLRVADEDDGNEDI